MEGTYVQPRCINDVCIIYPYTALYMLSTDSAKKSVHQCMHHSLPTFRKSSAPRCVRRTEMTSCIQSRRKYEWSILYDVYQSCHVNVNRPWPFMRKDPPAKVGNKPGWRKPISGLPLLYLLFLNSCADW